MKLFTKNYYIIPGADNKPISIDAQFIKNEKKKPIVIFSHGFKGFKDWGQFNLVAEAFSGAEFVFVKFNFSHNGTSPDHLTEFVDPDAFGKNNFSKELDDLGVVIDFVLRSKSLMLEIDENKIFLLGHSRGGAISLLKCAEDRRVKKVTTWAAISDTEKRLNTPELENWKKTGIAYVENARTKQQLPLYYQFYEDFYKHKKRLDLVDVAKKINIPVLIVHGENDSSVFMGEANDLHARIKDSELFFIPDADHALGGKHPWNEPGLPAHTKIAIDKTTAFFRRVQ